MQDTAKLKYGKIRPYFPRAGKHLEVNANSAKAQRCRDPGQRYAPGSKLAATAGRFQYSGQEAIDALGQGKRTEQRQ